MDEVRMQRDFFTRVAASYDSTHASEHEHRFALTWLEACIDFYGFTSFLEIGAGTGRALDRVQKRFPQIRCIGIEPVQAMRNQGYARGLSRDTLIDGDAYNLQFPNASFDIAAEFAVLHHAREPERVVTEMLRVAHKAIFISDCNNFGHGNIGARLVKFALRTLHLWPLFIYARTRGRGYYVSEGDGVAYSYSVFNNLSQIRKACSEVYLLNTNSLDFTQDPLLSASHVALLGLKSC